MENRGRKIKLVSLKNLYTRIKDLLDIKWANTNVLNRPNEILINTPPNIKNRVGSKTYTGIFVHGGIDNPETWFQGNIYWQKITFNVDVVTTPSNAITYEKFQDRHYGIVNTTERFMRDITKSSNVVTQLIYMGSEDIYYSQNPLKGQNILHTRLTYRGDVNSEFIIGDINMGSGCPPDSIKPTISSGTYTTGDGIITLTFHENLQTFTPGLMSMTDGTNTVTMTGGSLSNNVVTFTLSEQDRVKFITSTTLTMSLKNNAVKDKSNNFLSKISFLLDIQDTEKPKFVSGSYDRHSGIITLNFTEEINTINGSGLTLKSGSLTATLTGALQKSGSIITETLSGSTKTQFDSITTMTLDIAENAITDNSRNGISASTNKSISVIIPDTTKPTLSSVTYDTHAGKLNLVFSEAIQTSVSLSKIGISNTSGTYRYMTTQTATVSSNVLEITMDSTYKTEFSSLSSSTYVVNANAVLDIAGNTNASLTGSVTITESEKPTFVSGEYLKDTGKLTLTFSEAIKSFVPGSLSIHSGSNNYTLSSSATKNGSKITETLSGSDKSQFNEITSMTLNILTGAVTDNANNTINASTGNTIVVNVSFSLSDITNGGLYEFEDNVNDTSGNGRNLNYTSNRTLVYTTGKLNKALQPSNNNLNTSFSTNYTPTLESFSNYDLICYAKLKTVGGRPNFVNGQCNFSLVGTTSIDITFNSVTENKSISIPLNTWFFLRLQVNVSFVTRVLTISITLNSTSISFEFPVTLRNRLKSNTGSIGFSGASNFEIDSLMVKFGNYFSNTDITNYKNLHS